MAERDASGRGYALVTGASKGLGAEMAEQLAAAKWDLILVARSQTELAALAARLAAKHGIKAVAIAQDLAAPGASLALFEAVTARQLAVEVLVNNAGFGLLGPFRESSLARELEMIQVNVTALTELTKLFLPAMLAKKRGFILNVASTAAFVPGPFMSVYYASKAYVLSLSEALFAELAGTGVVVSCLCPGATRTQFAETAKSTESKLFKQGNVMDAAPVVKAGLAGLFGGKSLVIPGFQNKLVVQSLRVAPRALSRSIAGGMQEPG